MEEAESCEKERNIFVTEVKWTSLTFKESGCKEKEQKNWEKPLVQEKRKHEKKRKNERKFEGVAMWHTMWEDLVFCFIYVYSRWGCPH